MIEQFYLIHRKDISPGEVDLGVIVQKWYFPLPRSLELKPHYHV